MNRTVETNLLAIITGLTAGPRCCQDAAAGCGCVDATIKKEEPDAV
jgi:hypothetical protein